MGRLMFFITFESFIHYFFKYSFCSFLSCPSVTLILPNLVHLMETYGSLKFKSFFFIIFSLCSPNKIISIDLPSSLLILFSACSNLVSSLSSDFHLLLYFLTSVISIRFLSVIDILYVVRHHCCVFL